MSPVVRLPQNLYERLGSHANGFDTPANVIMKILDYYEKSHIPELKSQTEIIKQKSINTKGRSRISQEELMKSLIDILKKYKCLHKAEVESEIFRIYRDTFSSAYYQDTVANGVTRWKHNLAWARNRARELNLIKEPSESGRGIWEITEEGITYLQND